MSVGALKEMMEENDVVKPMPPSRLDRSYSVLNNLKKEKYNGRCCKEINESLFALALPFLKGGMELKLPLLLAFLFLSLSHKIFTQNQPLTLDSYLELVRQNHPTARQAFLLTDRAHASLLQARGGFDPKLYGDWERKSFDGKNYFNIGEGGVKVPTWFGIEGKLAYNYTNGFFLNPENKLPSDGQTIVGFTVPLLQGLVIDDRRAGLFQAKILRSANANEQRLLVNDLLFGATKIYWEWALAEAYFDVYERAVKVAAQRFEGVRESFFQGDSPAIDTLESFIQVQSRRIQRNDARVAFRNAYLNLQNFLWGNENPLPIDTMQTPIGLESPVQVPDWSTAPISELADAHPAVLGYDFKIQQLEVERRLKTEKLKPRLDVSYNLLGDGFDLQPGTDDGNFSNLFRENYKLGATASFPLLLRKERGGLRLTDLKLTEAGLSLNQKRQEVRNKIAAYQNDLNNLRQQIELASQMRNNYVLLLEAENTKFAIGESSIFLINSRENKLIEAELKLAKLQAELRKAEVGLQWAAGRLY